MFEEGAAQDVEALISGWLPTYHRSGTLHGHIAWHGALSALERGDSDGALAIYERHVQPSVSLGLPINIMTDAVSLLWRLQAYGYDVPTHMGLLAAATGDRAMARIEALSRLVEQGTLAAGPVVPAICRAALAFAEGDYAGCVHMLEPMIREVVRIGGSGAEREVFEDTLLLALMRSGEVRKARDLLDKRLHRRPSPRDTRWRNQIAA
jgi:hypothetical protein